MLEAIADAVSSAGSGLLYVWEHYKIFILIGAIIIIAWLINNSTL